MGAEGNQDFEDRQNKTLSKSNENGVKVLLLEVGKPNKYTFRGRVELAGETYFEIQKDQNGEDRKVCKFPLKVVEEKYEYSNR